MKARVDLIAVLAVVLCAVVLVGEYATYSTEWLGYDSDVEWSDGTVTVTISSSGVSAYDVVVIDNAKDVSLMIYIDDEYDTYYDEACEYSTIPYEEQEYFAEQIAGFLSLRSYDDVSYCHNNGLAEYLEETMGQQGAALMVTSYALPSDVYDGTENCPLLEWVEAGGNLYWVGTEIGRFYTDSDGLCVVEGNQVLFFGMECVNTSGKTTATEVVDNGFTEALGLHNNDVTNGVDVSSIEGALAMGYSENGYSTVAIVPFGDGEITVISGSFTHNSGSYILDKLDDLGQLVVSGVSSSSTVLVYQTGEKESGDLTLEIQISGEWTEVAVYVSIGGTYIRYAEVYYE